MTQIIADRKDIEFVLYEQMNVVLPATDGKMYGIQSENNAMVTIGEKAFAG